MRCATTDRRLHLTLALLFSVTPLATNSFGQDAAIEATENVDQQLPVRLDDQDNESASDGSDVGSIDRDLRFNFREAPWPEVLQQFAEWSDLSLDLTDVPPGNFSYLDRRSHTPSEAIDILNGYLLPRGYVLVRRDRFLVAMKTDNAALQTIVPTIQIDQLRQRGENELVRILVPLDDVNASKVAEELKPMLGPLGSITPSETSQSVLVQGFGRTLREILLLLGNAQPTITDEKLSFRSFTLRHLPAAEAERQIKTLFGLNNGVMNVSRSGWERRSRRRDRDDDDDERSRPRVPLLQQVATNMKVSALSRTNSLLVTATPAGIALVEEILQSIDVSQGANVEQIVDDTEPVLRVYRLGDADEEEVAKTLDVVFPGVVVNEDRRQDSIHVLATPAEHREVEELISTLDQGGTAGHAVEVFHLRRFNATAMSSLLSGMFENDDRDIRPVIQPEPQTRTIIVRGSRAQVEQVRQALAAYGEGDGPSQTTGDGRFRRVIIDRGNAESVARAVERLLSNDRGFDNPIRVVVPGATDSRPDPPRRQPSSDPSPQTRSTNRDASRWRSANVRAIARLEATETSASVRDASRRTSSPASTTDQDKSPRPRKSRVTVEVQGDELFLYSSDSDALKEVEETVRDLVRQMPDRMEWTVFYLLSSEAEATSKRLYELLPYEALFPTTTSNTTAIGNPAKPLEIVPEPRTNALFVSGPEDRIAEVEQLLRILDSNKVPQSLRERLPRVIPVRYADVNEMAQVVRTLYADYLTGARGGREGREQSDERRENDERRERDEERERDRDDGDRDNGRRSTDRRRGNDSQRSAQSRLMLAIDERTRELIVSCDKPLFDEIQALVEDRDQAARDVPYTVRSVPMNSYGARRALEALEALPNVTVRRIEQPDVPAPPVRRDSRREGSDRSDRESDRRQPTRR